MRRRSRQALPTDRLPRLTTAVAVAGLGLAVHASVNARLLRAPQPAGRVRTVTERISVMVPARDEGPRIASCVRALLAQRRVPDLEVLVCDDGSGDDTAQVVEALANADPRLHPLTGTPPPAGWLGKPHACAQLAAKASGDVLVFVDADVVVAPHGIAAAVGLLRDHGLALVSPYPRQLADGIGPRLVQPLLQWSWLTFLPLRLAESSARPSMVAANGQLLVCDATVYARAGGHAACADQVLEDLALARAVKAAGGRVAVADGTQLATCRMYADWPALRDGYTKSLWVAGGSPAGSAALAVALATLTLLPPASAMRALALGRRRAAIPGLVGTAAGIASRLVSAWRTGGKSADALAHPASVAVVLGLGLRSWRQRRRGALTWKGRALPGHG